MENFDYDLQSVQEARNLARLGKIATDKLAGEQCSPLQLSPDPA